MSKRSGTTDASIGDAVEPRAAETAEFDDVSDAQLERAVKILERREARRLGEDRKGAGLRDRHVVLRYIGATATGYPAGACTAHDYQRPERIRCDGQHIVISHQERVYPGDLIEQPAGHIADLSGYVVVEEAQ